MSHSGGDSVAIGITVSLFPHLHTPFPNKPYGFCGREAPSCVYLVIAVQAKLNATCKPSVIRIGVKPQLHRGYDDDDDDDDDDEVMLNVLRCQLTY